MNTLWRGREAEYRARRVAWQQLRRGEHDQGDQKQRDDPLAGSSGDEGRDGVSSHIGPTPCAGTSDHPFLATVRLEGYASHMLLKP